MPPPEGAPGRLLCKGLGPHWNPVLACSGMVATGALQRAPRVRIIVCALRMRSVCAALQLMRSYKLSLLNGQAHASAAPVTLFSGCKIAVTLLIIHASIQGAV